MTSVYASVLLRIGIWHVHPSAKLAVVQNPFSEQDFIDGKFYTSEIFVSF